MSAFDFWLNRGRESPLLPGCQTIAAPNTAGYTQIQNSVSHRAGGQVSFVSPALARLCLLLGVPDMPFEITTQGAVLFARVFGVFTAPDLNHLASEAEIAEASHPVSLDR